MGKPFAYRRARHARKHGPGGYKQFQPYRPWLRDEFTFRCVFCLRREQWGTIMGMWDIDHFVPQSGDGSLTLTYDNLLYACRPCNIAKSNSALPDPCVVGYGKCLRVHRNGKVTALNDDGKLLIETLRLDNEDHTNFRALILATLRSLKKNDQPTYVLWMSYPQNLPDLGALRPNFNMRPNGVASSYYAQRASGRLPKIY